MDLTGLLRRWADGDAVSASRLVDQLHAQLKAIASRQLSRERAGNTLQPTALVHEAYLKLVAGGPVDWRSRRHFRAPLPDQAGRQRPNRPLQRSRQAPMTQTRLLDRQCQ